MQLCNIILRYRLSKNLKLIDKNVVATLEKLKFLWKLQNQVLIFISLTQKTGKIQHHPINETEISCLIKKNFSVISLPASRCWIGKHTLRKGKAFAWSSNLKTNQEASRRVIL